MAALEEGTREGLQAELDAANERRDRAVAGQKRAEQEQGGPEAAGARGETGALQTSPVGMETVEWRGTAFELRRAEVNGICIRYASIGPASGPLVLFCHGWPELWYSWRHQLVACAKAGFYAVAPDMRGYGGTSAPGGRGTEGVEQYSIDLLAADAVGLVHHLGYSSAVLVGHDWGGWAVWRYAALHPDVFTAVCAMSVPYYPTPTLTELKQKHGDPENPAEDPEFFYWLSHSLPDAAEHYELDVSDTLRCIFGALGYMEPGSEYKPAKVLNAALYVDGARRFYLDRAPRRSGLPPWISEDELAYFVKEYERTGFSGGLHWYQTLDLNAAIAPATSRAQQEIQQPALFIAGKDDVNVQACGGHKCAGEHMQAKCKQLQGAVFLEETGHWVQQEKPEQVNAELLSWLRRLDLRPGDQRTGHHILVRPSTFEADSPCTRELKTDSRESRGETVVAALRRWAQAQPERVLYTWLDEQGNEEQAWTYRELVHRANAVGHALRHRWGCEPGDRTALMYLPGLEFIAAFWGCLLAGVVSVPVYPVDLRGDKFELSVDRFKMIVDSCQPKLVLSHSEYLRKKRLHGLSNMFGSGCWPEGLEFGATDELEPRADCGCKYEPRPEDLAFLQFTSGSTGDPKGVMVSHSNLTHNACTMEFIGQLGVDDTGVSWLPQYHDLGLIGYFLLPASIGGNTVFMSPMLFLQKPGLWLSTISHCRATHTSAPNFAYQRCVDKRRVILRDHPMESLALSQLKFAMNAAEPVRPSTLKAFVASYSGAGFCPAMWNIAYGLAENTLFAAGFPHEPVLLSLRQDSLADGLIELALNCGCVELVGCGCPQPSSGVGIKIINPTTSAEAVPNQVAEIWVSGPSKAQGYWGKPELSRDTFQATIQDDPTGTEYLRTGDLGFIHQGELYICGRLKDLIIVNGKNYFPQDIECTAEASHELLKPGCSAAFSVEAAGEERLVVVAEVRGEPDEPTRQSVLGALRSAVARDHGLEVHAALLLRERTVFKTTSGKIRRRACKQGFLAWREQQQAARPTSNQTGWTDVIRSGVSGLCAAVLPGSSGAGVFNVVAHLVNMDEHASDLTLSGYDGAELTFSDCLDGPGWDQTNTTATDALVVGAGIVGLCFARDLASEGYSVVVVERSEGIGGTWRTNDYPGLRLHQPGATYRCLSLAPDWTKHHDADKWYRPTREEVMAYIEQLAAHPLISVMLNCEYLSHSKEHGQSSFVVTTSRAQVRARFVFESTGCFIGSCGAPRIPAELNALHAGELGGPGCFHSSQLSPEVFARVVASDKVVVVGSGKAAIDVLQQLKPGPQTVWAHRGHTAFMARPKSIEDFSQDGLLFQNAIRKFTAKSGSFTEWPTAALEAGWLISCDGPITAQAGKFRGGIVDPEELEWANQFDQLDLCSIEACEGGVTFSGTSRNPLKEVKVACPEKQTVVRLVRRPDGHIVPGQDLVVDQEPLQPGPPPAGKLLLHRLFLSLDPAMRTWMDDIPSYVPVALGAVMRGTTVNEVVQSSHPSYQPGDLVMDNALEGGWSEFALADAAECSRLRSIPGVSLSAHLGVLGFTGLAAYFGLLRVGKPKPGDVVVVRCLRSGQC